MPLTLEVLWSDNGMETLGVSENGSLYRIDQAGPVLLGQGSNVTTTSYESVTRNYTINYQGEHTGPNGVQMFAELTFNFTATKRRTRFKCAARCNGILIKRILNLERMHPSCDVKRYNDEYPCKYIDYEDVHEARACIRFVRNTYTPWDEAQALCKFQFYGNLVRISDKVLDTEITEILKNEVVSDYWIGLHNRRMMDLYQHAWLDDTHQPSYINLDFHGRKFYVHSCAIKLPRPGKWKRRDCYRSISHFICQITSARLPGLPTLTSTLKHGHLHQYAGFEMSFHCSSFTDRGAKLTFRIHKSYGVTEIYSSSAIYGGVKFTLEEDGRFVEAGDRCFMRSKATLRVNISSELFKTSLSCCWYIQSLSFCSENLQVILRYPPKRPDMAILSPYLLSLKSFLLATCSAFVGSSGQLEWSLVMLDGRLEWISGFIITNHHLFNPQDVHYEGTEKLKVTVDPRNGPHILSTLKIQVTEYIDGSVLFCRSFNPDNITVRPVDVTVHSSVIIVYGLTWWTDVRSALKLLPFLMCLTVLPMSICWMCGLPLAQKSGKVKPAPDKSRLRKKKGRKKLRRPQKLGNLDRAKKSYAGTRQRYKRLSKQSSTIPMSSAILPSRKTTSKPTNFPEIVIEEEEASDIGMQVETAKSSVAV